MTRIGELIQQLNKMYKHTFGVGHYVSLHRLDEFYLIVVIFANDERPSTSKPMKESEIPAYLEELIRVMGE